MWSKLKKLCNIGIAIGGIGILLLVCIVVFNISYSNIWFNILSVSGLLLVVIGFASVVVKFFMDIFGEVKAKRYISAIISLIIGLIIVLIYFIKSCIFSFLK